MFLFLLFLDNVVWACLCVRVPVCMCGVIVNIYTRFARVCVCGVHTCTLASLVSIRLLACRGVGEERGLQT